jgi:hypothetical protein
MCLFMGHFQGGEAFETYTHGRIMDARLDCHELSGRR